MGVSGSVRRGARGHGQRSVGVNIQCLGAGRGIWTDLVDCVGELEEIAIKRANLVIHSFVRGAIMQPLTALGIAAIQTGVAAVQHYHRGGTALRA